MVVGLVFGGDSSEYDISRKSVMNFIENLDKKHEMLRIGISRQGRMMLHHGEINEIKDDTWEKNSKDIVFSNNKQKKGIYVMGEDGFIFKNIDVIIPVLHGQNGEDGVIQGLLKMSGIDFVGCDVLASAVGFDKYMAKLIVNNSGIRQARCHFVSASDYDASVFKEEVKKLGLPVFVKPCQAGSSIGVTRVENLDELDLAIRNAFKYDNRVLVEEGIVGREVECAVLGNENPQVSGVGEIKSENTFYDFHSKYESDVSETVVSAQMDDATREKIRDSAKEIYKLLNCSGLSRVDFFIEDGTGDVIFNEINTFPGFTGISMYPMLFKAKGYTMTTLIEELINLAKGRR